MLVRTGALPVSMVSHEVQQQFQEQVDNRPQYLLDERARKSLMRAARAMRQSSWISFWSQLGLSIVSSLVFLFSLGFTGTQGSIVSLLTATYGIASLLVSTVLTLNHTRTAGKMQRFAYARANIGNRIERIKKEKVLKSLSIGSLINMSGLCAALVGIQSNVGFLVASTLKNSAVNPGDGLIQPQQVMTIDVFLVQALVNVLMGHFVSLCFQFWMSYAVSTRNVPYRNSQ